MRSRLFTPRLAVMLVALGATAAALHAAPSRAEDVTINFLHAQNERTYGPVIEAFEKANPGIKVREQRVPFDQLNAQVQARIGAGDDSIDLYGVDEPRVPALAKRGLLMDLSAQKNLVVEKTTPEAVAATSTDGKLYALPQWTSTQLLFYNKDLLAKAGITPPSADPAHRMTWDQLLADAKKVQAAGAKYGVAFEQVDRYYQLQPLFESSGAGSGLTGPGLLTPAVNTEKWVQTMTWARCLRTDRSLISSEGRGISTTSSRHRTSSGRLRRIRISPMASPSRRPTRGPWGSARTASTRTRRLNSPCI